jgi:hypothetical protein
MLVWICHRTGQAFHSLAWPGSPASELVTVGASLSRIQLMTSGQLSSYNHTTLLLRYGAFSHDYICQATTIYAQQGTYSVTAFKRSLFLSDLYLLSDRPAVRRPVGSL